MYSWMTIQGTDYRRLRTAEALTPRAADQAQPAPSLDGAPLRRERRARDAGHQLWRQRGKRLPADAASGRTQASTLAHFELLALARRQRLDGAGQFVAYCIGGRVYSATELDRSALHGRL